MAISKFDRIFSAAGIHLIRRLSGMALYAFLFCGVVALLIGTIFLIIAATASESDSSMTGQVTGSSEAAIAEYDSASERWVLDGSRGVIVTTGVIALVIGSAILLVRRFLQKSLQVIYLDRSSRSPEPLKVTHIKSSTDKP